MHVFMLLGCRWLSCYKKEFKLYNFSPPLSFCLPVFLNYIPCWAPLCDIPLNLSVCTVCVHIALQLFFQLVPQFLGMHFGTCLFLLGYFSVCCIVSSCVHVGVCCLTDHQTVCQREAACLSGKGKVQHIRHMGFTAGEK